jgi:hypothetical protein
MTNSELSHGLLSVTLIEGSTVHASLLHLPPCHSHLSLLTHCSSVKEVQWVHLEKVV